MEVLIIVLLIEWKMGTVKELNVFGKKLVVGDYVTLFGNRGGMVGLLYSNYKVRVLDRGGFFDVSHRDITHINDLKVME